MALNLLQLLGQAAGVQVPPPGVPEGDPITVTGRLQYDPRQDPQLQNYADPEPRPEITPRYVLNDDRMQPTPEEMQELLPRKGMFGVKGTLRDVLGTLGDAFLVQANKDRVYAPRRQTEKEADAMFGFTQDPMQAIERLATQNPAAAEELYKTYQQAEYQKSLLASQDAARQNLMQDRNFGNREVGLNRLSRWVAGGVPYDRIIAGAKQYGISPEELAELGINPNMTDEERQQFASGDMTVNQQVQIPFTERRVATGEFNAQTARIAATRPRASARPRADTDQEYYREIIGKDPSEWSDGEADFVQKYLHGTRGSGRINAPPPPASGKPASRFRIVN